MSDETNNAIPASPQAPLDPSTEFLRQLPESYEQLWDAAKEDFQGLANMAEADKVKLRSALEGIARLSGMRLIVGGDSAQVAAIDKEIAFVTSTMKFMGARYQLDLATIAVRHARAAAELAWKKVFDGIGFVIRTAL